MRARRFIPIVVLLLGGAAQAVHTVSTLSEKEWEQLQQGLIGLVGPWNEGIAGMQGQPPAVSGASGDLLWLRLDSDSASSVLESDDSAPSPARLGEEAEEQPARGLIDDADITAGWEAGFPRIADAGKYSNTVLVSVGSRVDLPALADVEWIATPLPTAREASVMEIVVFPALAILVLGLGVLWLVLRLRRPKPVDAARHLLQV